MADADYVKGNVVGEQTVRITRNGKDINFSCKLYKGTTPDVDALDGDIYVSDFCFRESQKFGELIAYCGRVAKALLQVGFEKEQAWKDAKRETVALAKEKGIYGQFAGYLKDFGIEF